MTGTLKIGEFVEGFKQERVTSTFYRIEKLIKTSIGNYYDVYEFYTVNNGNMYYRHHEERVYEDGSRHLGAIMGDVNLGSSNKAKEEGNKTYSKLKKEGYKFVGIYECDFCGYAKRVK